MDQEDTPLLPTTAIDTSYTQSNLLRLLLILDLAIGSVMFLIYYFKYPNMFHDYPNLLQNVPFDLLLLCVLRTGLLLIFVLKVPWAVKMKMPTVTTFVSMFNLVFLVLLTSPIKHGRDFGGLFHIGIFVCILLG